MTGNAAFCYNYRLFPLPLFRFPLPLLRRRSAAAGHAGVAQLVEQRIRNAKVGSSTLSTGTNKSMGYQRLLSSKPLAISAS